MTVKNGPDKSILVSCTSIYHQLPTRYAITFLNNKYTTSHIETIALRWVLISLAHIQTPAHVCNLCTNNINTPDE